MEAKRRGAKIIHVDPRFTRTSALSDIHVPLRAGTDIAFLGGLINYVIANQRYLMDYVVHFTNAPALIPGRPSHGCIRLRNPDIERLYRLTPVGTPLRIR
jgi:anaerobic selenocysteine-containing dehydrogenase